MQIAALEAVLRCTRPAAADELPVRRMLAESLDDLSKRAHRPRNRSTATSRARTSGRSESVVGGGSMPGTSMPSWGVAVKTADPAAFAARLRAGSPSVFCRGRATTRRCSTCGPCSRIELPDLTRAIQYALEGDDVDED